MPGLSSNALSSAASDNFLPSFAMAPCVDGASIPDCFVVQGLSKCDRPLAAMTYAQDPIVVRITPHDCATPASQSKAS